MKELRHRFLTTDYRRVNYTTEFNAQFVRVD